MADRSVVVLNEIEERLEALQSGDRAVIHGDLLVQGNVTYQIDEIVEGTVTVDVDNAEAFLVRKNGDAGDVFSVDTVSSRVDVTGDFYTSGSIYEGGTALSGLYAPLSGGGYVEKTGDTMTGDLTIAQAGDTTLKVDSTNSTALLWLEGPITNILFNDTTSSAYDGRIKVNANVMTFEGGDNTGAPTTPYLTIALNGGAVTVASTLNAVGGLLENGVALSSIYAPLSGGGYVEKTGDTMSGDLTVPNLITAGLVDGIDVSVLDSTVSSHTGNTLNPHSVTKAQVGLANVEDTALSTWVGTTSITTLGTITSGTWNGTAIGATYITGLSSDDLSDVASIAMLDEDESVSGAWTFSGGVTYADQDVTFSDGLTPRFQSTGSPFTVASTTKVTNLNADLLDGRSSLGYMLKEDDLTSAEDMDTLFTPQALRVNANAANSPYASGYWATMVYGNGGNVTGQLSTHYSDGTTYIRSYNTAWSAWGKVWTSLNDGTGGGLDADLLDGQEGSYYSGLVSTHAGLTNNPHSVTKAQVGLGNVEDTALSTWTGTTSITTLGTIGAGTWQGTAIASAYIGSHNHAGSDINSGYIGTLYGGTGIATHLATGIARVTSGTWSIGALTSADITDVDAFDDATYNNSNWDTAYGWGDHASGGYASTGHVLGSHGNVSETSLTAGDLLYYNGGTWQNYVWTGATNVVTLGTISTGTWQGTAIASAYIGTHNHAGSDINSGYISAVYGGTGIASHLATGIARVTGGTWSIGSIDSDDLTDVASIAMLDEAETVSGAWTFSNTPVFSGTQAFQISETSTGMIYKAQEGAGTYTTRYFFLFDYTQDDSFPYLTNRTPSGKVEIHTGTTSAGGELPRMSFAGGDGNQPITLTNTSQITWGSESITEAKIGEWDTAYGWGDHAGLYAAASHSLGSHNNVSESSLTAGDLLYYNGGTWQNYAWTGATNVITLGTISTGTWQGTAIASAYIGTHNHNGSDINSGYISAVYGGTGIATHLSTGIARVTSGTWSVGALTSADITDVDAFDDATYNNSNWDTAYGWGDHSLVGYLTSETDSQTLSYTASTGSLSISNGNSVDIGVGTSDSPSFVAITSTVATGTAPFTVASTTKVTNLNADLIDGLSSGHLVRQDTYGTNTIYNNHIMVSDGGTANRDYIRHDDTGNAWHFVSDGSALATGNSAGYFGSIVTSGAITWSGGGSANANTAYGWGDHAGLYAAASHSLGSHNNVSEASLTAGQLLYYNGGTWQNYTWTGATNVITLGTISTGTWQGTAIASAYIGSHNHAGSDINSGYISAVYGGTGIASHLSTGIARVTGGTWSIGALTSSDITDVDAFSQSGTYASLRAQATTKADVGLSVVENTALSTWAGSANITTLGTISSGTIPAARVSAGTFGTGSFTVNGAVTWSGGSSTNANTAFSWGDHSVEGYLKSGDAPSFASITVTGAVTSDTLQADDSVTSNRVIITNLAGVPKYEITYNETTGALDTVKV